MIQLSGIQAVGIQTLQVKAPDGDLIDLTIRYCPTTRYWMMDVSYGDFVAKNIRMVADTNILWKFQNILNFGFSITSKTGLDPFLIDDFDSGRAILFLLDNSDKAYIEELMKQ